MTQRESERLTKVEAEIKYIGFGVERIEKMLSAHIEKEDQYLTKAQADKSYADIIVEKEFKNIKLWHNAITLIALSALLGIVGFFIQQIIIK